MKKSHKKYKAPKKSFISRTSAATNQPNYLSPKPSIEEITTKINSSCKQDILQKNTSASLIQKFLYIFRPDKINFKCFFGHKWGNGCICSLCGAIRPSEKGHDWSKNCESCTRCGKIRPNAHAWKKCTCEKCGKTRDEAHDWAGCKCKKCGKTRDEAHEWVGCKCEKCGKTRYYAHQWIGCKCGKCGETRDEAHDWTKDCEKCTSCGATRCNIHAWKGCTCQICGSSVPAGVKRLQEKVIANLSEFPCHTLENIWQGLLDKLLDKLDNLNYDVIIAGTREEAVQFLMFAISKSLEAYDEGLDINSMMISNVRHERPQVYGNEKIAAMEVRWNLGKPEKISDGYSRQRVAKRLIFNSTGDYECIVAAYRSDLSLEALEFNEKEIIPLLCFNDGFQRPLSFSPKIRKYRLDGWNIEFYIPIDWKVNFEDQPNPPSYCVFGISGQRETGSQPSLLLFTQIVEESGEDLSVYMDEAERQLRKKFDNFTLIKKWKDNYQDCPSVIMEYQYQGSGGIIQELNMTTFFGKQHLLAFQFICEADKDTVEQDRILQHKIINSLKVGMRGIRVPYLSPLGKSASKCAVCGSHLSEPNALFNKRESVVFLCDQCWRWNPT